MPLTNPRNSKEAPWGWSGVCERESSVRGPQKLEGTHAVQPHSVAATGATELLDGARRNQDMR